MSEVPDYITEIELHKNAINLFGQVFGRLTAIAPVGRSRGREIIWLCVCQCGSESFVRARSLKRGDNASCGCLHSDMLADRNTTHGKRHAPEYSSWAGMKSRCTNRNDPNYSDYGGRGITVCKRWLDFAVFISDMGERPSPKHSIDRIDNNGNYEPKNCRWATRRQQSRNKRNNRLIKFRGNEKCISAWAEEIGVSPGTIRNRINKGYPLSVALTAEAGSL